MNGTIPMRPVGSERTPYHKYSPRTWLAEPAAYGAHTAHAARVARKMQPENYARDAVWEQWLRRRMPAPMSIDDTRRADSQRGAAPAVLSNMDVTESPYENANISWCIKAERWLQQQYEYENIPLGTHQRGILKNPLTGGAQVGKMKKRVTFAEPLTTCRPESQQSTESRLSATRQQELEQEESEQLAKLRQKEMLQQTAHQEEIRKIDAVLRQELLKMEQESINRQALLKRAQQEEHKCWLRNANERLIAAAERRRRDAASTSEPVRPKEPRWRDQLPEVVDFGTSRKPQQRGPHTTDTQSYGHLQTAGCGAPPSGPPPETYITLAMAEEHRLCDAISTPEPARPTEPRQGDALPKVADFGIATRPQQEGAYLDDSQSSGHPQTASCGAPPFEVINTSAEVAFAVHSSTEDITVSTMMAPGGAMARLITEPTRGRPGSVTATLNISAPGPAGSISTATHESAAVASCGRASQLAITSTAHSGTSSAAQRKRRPADPPTFATREAATSSVANTKKIRRDAQLTLHTGNNGQPPAPPEPPDDAAPTRPAQNKKKKVKIKIGVCRVIADPADPPRDGGYRLPSENVLCWSLKGHIR